MFQIAVISFFVGYYDEINNNIESKEKMKVHFYAHINTGLY